MRSVFATLLLVLISALPASARDPVQGERLTFTDWYQPRNDSEKPAYRVKRGKATKVAKKRKTAPAIRQARQTASAIKRHETGHSLVSAARRFIGTNPTGWARLWCGRFMALIAPDAARRIGNPNLALNWAKLPRVRPHVGAVAVLFRRGGGHVGVVTGFDRHGNPIIISGNHNKRVAEARYSKARVYAYVAAL